MNFRTNKNAGIPSDQEIDRDVAELRKLLEGVEGPREPHPAYWQNFLVHVRERIDEDRFRRRRRIPSIALASATAVALVAIVLVSGVIDRGDSGTPADSQITASTSRSTSSAANRLSEQPLLASNVDPLFEGDAARRLVLDESDVRMLDAIMTDNDAAIFQAIVDSDDR